VVVVAAGFGLWQGGKCLAAGKWTDISQLRAGVRDTPKQLVGLVIQLRDGSEVEILEGAPGWDMLVNILPSKLPGTPNPENWIAELHDAPAGAPDRTLFERQTRGR
jgi:hypothetical protein